MAIRLRKRPAPHLRVARDDCSLVRLIISLLLSLALFPGTASARELWVDPARGSDRAPGTSAAPLRTVNEAWRRIPARRELTTGVTVQLRAGSYPLSAFPEYFESR